MQNKGYKARQNSPKVPLSCSVCKNLNTASQKQVYFRANTEQKHCLLVVIFIEYLIGSMAELCQFQ